MANNANAPEAPALTIAPAQYAGQHFNYHNNILRLFFNRLVAFLQGLTSTEQGGKSLYFPFGGFYDTTTQTAASADTAYSVSFGAETASGAISVVSSTQLTVSDCGLYAVQFSGQADTTGATTGNLHVWAAKSGTNITNSAREYLIPGAVGVHLSLEVELDIGDYLEIKWAVSTTDIQLQATAAAGAHPGVPSAVVSLVFASNAC